MDRINKIINDPVIWERVKKRLLKYIVCNNETGCWEYKGSVNGHGYGKISPARDLLNIRVHRIMYQYFYGDLQSTEDLVLHSCDNPPCCNPFHLRKGDHKDNSRDLMERGPYSPPPKHFGESHPMKRPENKIKSWGSNNGNSKYTEEDVVEAYYWEGGPTSYIGATGKTRNFYYAVRNKGSWWYFTDKLDADPNLRYKYQKGKSGESNENT